MLDRSGSRKLRQRQRIASELATAVICGHILCHVQSQPMGFHRASTACIVRARERCLTLRNWCHVIIAPCVRGLHARGPALTGLRVCMSPDPRDPTTVCDCMVVLRIRETAWAHYAFTRLRGHIIQSRDCVNSMLMWNIYTRELCLAMAIAL